MVLWIWLFSQEVEFEEMMFILCQQGLCYCIFKVSIEIFVVMFEGYLGVVEQFCDCYQQIFNVVEMVMCYLLCGSVRMVVELLLQQGEVMCNVKFIDMVSLVLKCYVEKIEDVSVLVECIDVLQGCFVRFMGFGLIKLCDIGGVVLCMVGLFFFVVV